MIDFNFDVDSSAVDRHRQRILERVEVVKRKMREKGPNDNQPQSLTELLEASSNLTNEQIEERLIQAFLNPMPSKAYKTYREAGHLRLPEMQRALDERYLRARVAVPYSKEGVRFIQSIVRPLHGRNLDHESKAIEEHIAHEQAHVDRAITLGVDPSMIFYTILFARSERDSSVISQPSVVITSGLNEAALMAIASAPKNLSHGDEILITPGESEIKCKFPKYEFN